MTQQEGFRKRMQHEADEFQAAREREAAERIEHLFGFEEEEPHCTRCWKLGHTWEDCPEGKGRRF